MLPLLIPLIIAGAAAAAGGAGAAASGMSDRELQKRTKARAKQLLQMEEEGKLGMTGNEQRQLDQNLNAPVAAAATSARQRAEQIAAASGSSSGAELAQFRQQQQKTQSEGAQRAALAVQQASATKKQQQESELEARLAALAAMRQHDIQGAMTALNQAAMVGGMAAGATPGTFQMAAPGGGAWQSQSALMALQQNPALMAQFQAFLAQQQGGAPAMPTSGGTSGGIQSMSEL